MATKIVIKRSGTAGNPSTLGSGELAYSYLTDNGSNGGDRLYIGTGTEDVNGDAQNHEVIGGKYFTGKLDHSGGVLTANSAILVDADKKIDEIYLGSGTAVGKTRYYDADGSNYVEVQGPSTVATNITFTLPSADGTTGQFLKTNGSGQLSFDTITSSFTITDGTNSDTFSTGGTLTFTGTSPINTTVSNDTVTIDVDDATTSTKGVASFATADFGVSSGAVSLSDTVLKSVTTDTGAMTVSSHAVSILGGTGMGVTHSGTTITVDADLASTSAVGVASFASADFSVSGTGEVTIGSLSNAQLDNSTITVTDGTNSRAVDLGDTLTITGGSAITSTVSTLSDSVTLDVAVDNSSIEVSSDALQVKALGITNAMLAGSIANAKLVNSTITVGDGTNSTAISLGGSFAIQGTANEVEVAESTGTFTVGLPSTISGLTGVSATNLTGTLQTAAQPNVTSLGTLTGLTVDNITLNGNDITTSTGDLSINPTGDIDVNNNKITSLGTPSADTDAATKAYVDSVAQGLHVHAACHIATTDTFAAMTSGTVTYDNGTSGVGATLTTTGTIPTTWDGHTLHDGDRILVKDESTAAHNGIYVYDSGSTTTITRADDFNTSTEIAGGDFVFVQFGTTNAETGWVQVNDVNTVGSDDIDFTQFSGAGHIEAGDGLSVSGTVFSVNVDDSSIEINTDTLRVKALGITNAMLAGSIDLTSKVTGTLPVTNGGTGATTFTSNGLLYGNGTGAVQATGAGTNGYFLYSNSGTPDWTNTIDGGTY